MEMVAVRLVGLRAENRAEYATGALVQLAQELGLRAFGNRLAPWSFVRDNPYEAKSLREVRCEERGLRIWRMRYDRPA